MIYSTITLQPIADSPCTLQTIVDHVSVLEEDGLSLSKVKLV